MNKSKHESPTIWPGECRAAISLCYDAGYQTQVDFAIPNLEKARIRATFFLDAELYLQNFAIWRQAFKAGNEIGNGSLLPWSLEDGSLTNWSTDAAMGEILACDELFLEALNITNPMLALPKGPALCSDGSLLKITENRVRRMPHESNNSPNGENDVYPIFCYGMSFDELKSIANKLAQQGGWGVLCFGEISEFNLGGPTESTTRQAHELFTKWLSEQTHLWLAPIMDVRAYQQAMTGFEPELVADETILDSSHLS